MVYNLSNFPEPVVWINNSSSAVIYLKGDPDSQGFAEELTIGTMGSVYFAGPLEFNGETAGMIGLVLVDGVLWLLCNAEQTFIILIGVSIGTPNLNSFPDGNYSQNLHLINTISLYMSPDRDR